MIDMTKLSKNVSHALRHVREDYKINLDEEGWVPIPDLVNSLKFESDESKDLTAEDIYEMVKNSEKKRHEIKGNLIRAMYGHSVSIEPKYKTSKPPLFLYHGTPSKTVSLISDEGLKPMKRLYVHLSAEKDTAAKVGKRKDNNFKVLKVFALNAFESGIDFYYINDKIWLAKSIPSIFIEF